MPRSVSGGDLLHTPPWEKLQWGEVCVQIKVMKQFLPNHRLIPILI